ncbi:hypothetical protein NMG60_11025987 [Bertholletia excelsa]
MEKSGQQATKPPEREEREGKVVRVPLEKSPYTQYKDLEDYKLQGYGAQGHQEPKPGRGAGATDAPTPSGDAASAEKQHGSTGVINRQGVP